MISFLNVKTVFPFAKSWWFVAVFWRGGRKREDSRKESLVI